MSGDLEFKRSQVKCSDLISAGAIVIGPPVRRIVLVEGIGWGHATGGQHWTRYIGWLG